jgi:F-type H+-transporting ATPase subunit epsilon
MANTFALEVLTPDRSFFTGDVEMIIIETPDGQMGVLRNHVPMVAAVAIGPMRILKDGQWLEAALSEGFMEVKQDKTIILCDTAEWPNEIDANRAKAAEERARERLQNQLSNVEYMRSQAALQRALSRLKVTKSIK